MFRFLIQRLKIKSHIQQARLQFFYFVIFLFSAGIFYIASIRVAFATAIVVFIDGTVDGEGDDRLGRGGAAPF